MVFIGVKTGYQYYMANRTLKEEEGAHETVASIAVMEKSNGRLDLLNGQNMFEVFIPAGKLVNGKIVTEYDESINGCWWEQAREYTAGNKTRNQAIEDFKKEVAETIDLK